ncbi:MAG: UMP kinase [Candidatus Methanomethylophilaceae archaeon]|nr:UMP kinase [Candidatus Methanomethylophilaceae archaeon]
MDKVVVSIGGSILIPDKDDSSYIRELSALLRELVQDFQIVVICGGGKISRYYANTGRELGGDTFQLDELGIMITRANAGLLRIALGDLRVEELPLDAERAAALSAPGNVVVMGGTVPGHTTDAVSAMVAKALGADRIVNATSVDAVYSEDPRHNPDAERYTDMTIDQLAGIVYSEHGAGKSSVFDPLGIRIAKENAIDIVIVDGRDLGELANAIRGQGFRGTLVRS